MSTPPLQITFRHMDSSAALEARIQEHASRLQRHSRHILRCHVVIEPPSAHHRTAPFAITLQIRVPGEEITIAAAAAPDHEDAYTAVADAFKAAARRLDDYEARRSQDIKAHSQPKPP